MASLREVNAKRIVQFYRSHSHKGKSFTVKHFVDEGFRKSSVYRILKRHENDLEMKRKVGSGKKPKIKTKEKVKVLKEMFNNKDEVSCRDAAKKFKCHYTYIRKTLSKLSIKYRKKIKSPPYSFE